MARGQRRKKLTGPGLVFMLILVLGMTLAALGYKEGALPILTDNETIQVSFLDVGQADAILVTQGAHSMLVDAGKNNTVTWLADTLKQQLPDNKLEVLVGTHPHEDHIGGLGGVIDAFDIGTLLMPKTIAATKTFEDVLDAMERKNLSASAPKVGDTFDLGAATVTVLAPLGTSYNETNDHSIVLRVTFGEVSFLLTGDAELLSEKEMLASNLPLQSTVLKVGHHGSTSSTSEAFLAAVNPQIAIISCGKDNSYGHPHSETLAALEAQGVLVYRTDLERTVTLTSDGKTVEIQSPEEVAA